MEFEVVIIIIIFIISYIIMFLTVVVYNNLIYININMAAMALIKVYVKWPW